MKVDKIYVWVCACVQIDMIQVYSYYFNADLFFSNCLNLLSASAFQNDDDHKIYPFYYKLNKSEDFALKA